MARIGLLTGGGDCPGLNGVIRGVVRRGLLEEGNSFVGFRRGWAGVLEGDYVELDRQATSGILPRGRHDPRLLPDQPLRRRGGRLGARLARPAGRRRRRADPDRGR